MTKHHSDQITSAMLDFVETLVLVALERIEQKRSVGTSDVRGCYDRKKAAEYLSIGLTTFDQLRKGGQIKETKLGGRIVFLKKDLDQFIKQVAKE